MHFAGLIVVAAAALPICKPASEASDFMLLCSLLLRFCCGEFGVRLWEVIKCIPETQPRVSICVVSK